MGTCGASGRGRTVAMHRRCNQCGREEKRKYKRVRGRWRSYWVKVV